MQSEYYLGPQGEPGSLEHMSHAAADPSLVVFNGVAGQYAEEPIHVEVGERIRTFVLNAGPSVDSSLPHRRHDLRRRRQGGHRARVRQPGRLGQPGDRPGSRAGRRRGVQPRGGRALPDRHPRVQLRRPRCAGPVRGGHRRCRGRGRPLTRSRSPSRASIRVALVALLGAGAALLWGAGRVAGGVRTTTRAVTVRAAPEAVWPWIAQLGQGRGGLYSYVWLEHALGIDIATSRSWTRGCRRHAWATASGSCRRATRPRCSTRSSRSSPARTW